MEHKALAGQNYYIDILGSDEIYPKQIMHHVPPHPQERQLLKDDDQEARLPEAWGGVKDSALDEVSKIPGCTFVHAGGKQDSGGSVGHGGGCAQSAKCFVIDW